VQLGELQERISEIEKLNAEVIAISSKGDQQDVEKIKRLLGATFTLIANPREPSILFSKQKKMVLSAKFGEFVK